MATDSTLTPFFTPDVKAITDLSGHQYKVVQFGSAGVQLATAAGSGAVWVLANKPTSGMACSLAGAPNISKCYADAATLRNAFVAVSATRSGFVSTAASIASAGFVGVALTAVASGSLVDVLLK